MKELRLSIQGNGEANPSRKKLVCSDGVRLVMSNDGPPAHVHLGFTDPLDDFFSINENNVYVEDETEVELLTGPVTEDVEGFLEITTGYGAHTERVKVIVEPEEMEVDDADDETVEEVEVDDSLSQPATSGSVSRMGEKAVVAGVVAVVVIVVLVGFALDFLLVSLAVVVAVALSFVFSKR